MTGRPIFGSVSWVLAIGLLCLNGTVPAWGGSFGMTPVRVTLSSERHVDAITVRNQGFEAAVMQLEPMAWAQVEGRDVYTPTTEILATPPIFTVPAGGSQIVRVGLRRAADPHRELSYRLFFQEVPPPRIDGFQGLRMVLRIGVPVFVAPEPVSGDPVLRWRLIQSSPTRVTARATNLGNTHVEIRDLELFSTNGAPAVARRAVSTTVLAAQSRDWIFELDRPLQDPRVHLTADTGSGHLDGGVLAVLARKPVDR